MGVTWLEGLCSPLALSAAWRFGIILNNQHICIQHTVLGSTKNCERLNLRSFAVKATFRFNTGSSVLKDSSSLGQVIHWTG